MQYKKNQILKQSCKRQEIRNRKLININFVKNFLPYKTMRIRSIKYKSSTVNLIDQNNQQSSPFDSQAMITNSDASGSQPNLKINGKIHHKEMFTEHFLNVKHLENISNHISLENKSQFNMGGIGNRVGIKSQKFAIKACSLYQDAKTYVQKQNRTSIFQGKQKGLLKGLQRLSVNEKKTPRRQKIRFRLSKFSQHFESIQEPISKKSPFQTQNHQILYKDQIILGNDLTYNLQCLQNQMEQIRQQTSNQHKKIQKIQKDLTSFTTKIQRQLQQITHEFHKGLDNLNAYMSGAKTEKCTILANWKNLIEEKTREYQEQKQMIEEVDDCVDRIKGILDGKELDCTPIEIDGIDETEG